MNKLLTITIPAYNVEQFLTQAVESVAKSQHSKEIEVLIINDGSKDGTAKVARELCKQYNCAKLINKENGGHGSTINCGLEQASGKYFRVLDGDDWLDTEALDRFMDKLAKIDSDIVLSDYVEHYEKQGNNKPVALYANLTEDVELKLEEIDFIQYGPLLSTTTIKTETLRSAKFPLDEHCFYVDQEFNLASYLSAQTLTYLPIMLYQYRLEREGQSMQIKSMIKNVRSHEKICARLLSEFDQRKAKLSPKQLEHARFKIVIPMCYMQYKIAIEYCRSRKEFLHFDEILKKYPEFYNSELVAGRTIKLHRMTNGLSVTMNDKIKKLSHK